MAKEDPEGRPQEDEEEILEEETAQNAVLSMFDTGEGDDSWNPEDFGDDDLVQIIVERTHPAGATGRPVHIATLRPHEIPPEDPEDWLMRLLGGGTFRFRMKVNHKWLKGRMVSKTFEAPRKSVEQITDDVATFRDPRGLNRKPVMREEAPAPRRPEAAPDNPTPQSPGMPGWVRAPQVHQFMPMQRDDEEELGGLAKIMALTMGPMQAMVQMLMAEVQSLRQGGPQNQVSLEQFRSMSELQREQVSAIIGMTGEAFKAHAAHLGAMQVQGFKLLGDLVKESRDAEDDGDFMTKLPGLINKFMQPLAGGGAAAFIPPSLPSSPPPARISGPAAATPAAAGPAGPPAAGAPRAPTPEDVKAYAAAVAKQALAQLMHLIAFQPDAELAWDQTMSPTLAMLPKKIRDQIQALPESAGGAELGAILCTIEGVTQAEIEAVAEYAMKTDGGLDWLSEFWDCAPWKDLEEDDEGEPGDDQPGLRTV